MRKAKIFVFPFVLALTVALCASCKGSDSSKNTDAIVEAYQISINNYISENDDRVNNPEGLRFEFGFIDGDNIPELLVCFGTGGVDAISIYSYNPDTCSAESWGNFSSRGSLVYYEKQGLVVSQYGNQGFFPHVYESIENGNRNVVMIEAQYFSEDGIEYYMISPCDGSSAQTSEQLMDHEVSSEEYTVQYEKVMNEYKKDVLIEYDSNMTAYSSDALRNRLINAIEDVCDMSFPSEVCEALSLLTHINIVSYMEYIERIKKNPIARTVKIADIAHNLDTSRLEPSQVNTEKTRDRLCKYKAALSLLSLCPSSEHEFELKENHTGVAIFRCKKCLLEDSQLFVPEDEFTEKYWGSIIGRSSYVWKKEWSTDDIVSFELCTGEIPMVNFTFDGECLEWRNRADRNSSNGKWLDNNFFAKHRISLSCEQINEIKRHFISIVNEDWCTSLKDYKHLYYDGYHRKSLFRNVWNSR